MNNHYYLWACNRIKDLGPRRIAGCLRRWPDLADMFRASIEELAQCGLPKQVALSIKRFDFRQLAADEHWLKDSHNHILSWDSVDYPYLLKEIDDPPPILYARGDLSCLREPCLAMVGMRHPSAVGAQTAWRFAHELGQAGLTIVSGLALGIDAQAHSGALAAEAKTVAVMGTGIDTIYPRRHYPLAAEIAAQGLLLSEFPLGSLPHAGHFPRRNRIISGLSSAVLVVEAAVRSGSLITARFAMEQNRDVFAIPGSIYHPQAQGCHRLVQQGARLVTSVQEVKDALQWLHDPVAKTIPISTEVCENEYLLSCIGFEATTIDHIMACSGLAVHEVLCAVAQLEIQGCVQIVPGGYMRCQQ